MWNMVCFLRRAIGVPFLGNTKYTLEHSRGKYFPSNASQLKRRHWKRNCFPWVLTCCVRQRVIPQRLTGLKGIPALPSEQLTWNRHHILQEDSSLNPAEQSSGLLQLGHHRLRALKGVSLHSPHTCSLCLWEASSAPCSIKAESVTLGRRPLPGKSLMESGGSKPTPWHPYDAQRPMPLPANPFEHIKSLGWHAQRVTS